jgi:hypothetical protein
MKLKKKELTCLIREAVLRSLKEMGHGISSFEFEGLEIGPVTVHYVYLPYWGGSREQPPEGGYSEIQGFTFNGKTVQEDEIVAAENQKREQTQEQEPLTVDQFMEMVQQEADNQEPDEPDYYDDRDF